MNKVGLRQPQHPFLLLQVKRNQTEAPLGRALPFRLNPAAVP
jgi:hypothetical protein